MAKFEVLSRLKHDGHKYEAGHIMEADAGNSSIKRLVALEVIAPVGKPDDKPPTTETAPKEAKSSTGGKKAAK